VRLKELKEAHPKAEVELWAEDEALGPKAGGKASMGTGGNGTCCSLQEGLQMDLSLRFCATPERRGLLTDRAHGKHRAVLDGSTGVR
jgi:hypothetical protein